MSQTRSFANDPGSVSAARHFASQALGGAGSDLLDAIELMVSELATNCVRHTPSGFELTVVERPGEIRVEVTDHGGGEPTMRSPAPDEPTGRGLQIVNLLSEQWGIRPREMGGKTVWFTVPTARAASAAGCA
jgi:anti-sigma regulatory factor (Ser/Thr protein kinase)